MELINQRNDGLPFTDCKTAIWLRIFSFGLLTLELSCGSMDEVAFSNSTSAL